MGCAGCGSCKCGDKKTPEEISAYYDGMVEGIGLYGWWKDGVQYVGTTGRTYRDAINQIEAKREKVLAK